MHGWGSQEEEGGTCKKLPDPSRETRPHWQVQGVMMSTVMEASWNQTFLTPGFIMAARCSCYCWLSADSELCQVCVLCCVRSLDPRAVNLVLSQWWGQEITRVSELWATDERVQQPPLQVRIVYSSGSWNSRKHITHYIASSVKGQHLGPGSWKWWAGQGV